MQVQRTLLQNMNHGLPQDRGVLAVVVDDCLLRSLVTYFRGTAMRASRKRTRLARGAGNTLHSASQLHSGSK